jgi:arginyl-tRNA synthetase
MIAYTRIRSIFRKAEEQGKAIAAGAAIVLKEPDELALAKQLLNFGFVLEALVEECRPNYMCNYLYDLAGFYAKFYESCPVLKAEEPERSSRLLLCEVTAKVLKQGLEVLGIETTEKM